MSPALFAAFVGATTLLMLIPGPNVALIVANSLSFGVRAGLLTVAGTSAAMVVQLAAASLGVTALLGAMAQAFEWSALAGRRLSGVARGQRLAGAGGRSQPDGRPLAVENLRPGLSRLADQSEDARLLRRLPAAVPRFRRAARAPDGDPEHNLRRDRPHRRRRLGYAGRAGSQLRRPVRPGAQPPDGRSPHRRGGRSGAREAIRLTSTAPAALTGSPQAFVCYCHTLDRDKRIPADFRVERQNSIQPSERCFRQPRSNPTRPSVLSGPQILRFAADVRAENGAQSR